MTPPTHTPTLALRPTSGSLGYGAGLFGRLSDAVDEVEPYRRTGRVSEVTGLIVESAGPSAVVGEVCHVHPSGGAE